MQQKRHRIKKKVNKTDNRVLDRSKLLFILLGTIFILFGVVIGQVRVFEYTIPFYFPIAIGLFLQLSSILIFVKQKQIKI